MHCEVIARGTCVCGSIVTLALPLTGDRSRVMVLHKPKSEACALLGPKRKMTVEQQHTILVLTVRTFSSLSDVVVNLAQQGKKLGRGKLTGRGKVAGW